MKTLSHAITNALPENPGRRRLLQAGTLALAGLVLELSPCGRVALAAQTQAEPFIPNAWIRISPDDRVTLVVHKFDSGTGIKNALALIVAEELDADWDRVQVVQPDDPLAAVYIHPLWGMHATGGSTSVSLEWDTLRKAGATARAMLVQAAAALWEVDPASCLTESGRVKHPASGRVLRYGALAEKASAMSVPDKVPLKAPAHYTLIGKQRASYRIEDKLRGRARYAIDIKLPGLLTAIVVHAPVVHATVRQFNEAEIRSLPGVRDVFVMDVPQIVAHFRPELPPTAPDNGATQPGIAIVADHFWAAQQARAALKAEWNESRFSTFNSNDVMNDMRARADEPGLQSRREADAQALLDAAHQTVEAVYEMPYKAHAQMEPTSMVAWVQKDKVEYWGGVQVPSRCAQAAQTIAGLGADKVIIHITEAGGSFGNREGLHPILEATYISKRVGAPIKLLYSREDDMQALYYHAASVHKASAALASDGKLQALSLRAVVPSIKEPDDPGFLKKVPVDPSCTEAMRSDFYYDMEALDLAWVRHETGLPTWWWRAVSYVPNIFAIESLVDEAALAAGQDPYQYRRRLLAARPDHLAVLDKAASIAGWNGPDRNQAGRGLGIATYAGYKSYIAVVADVMVRQGEIRIQRISCVVDCGLAIDPSSVRQQLYGGIVWGISTALQNDIHIENGRVKQSNYHDYPVPRMPDVPEVDIVLMPPSGRSPSGVGELSNSVVPPAIANAIHAATGQRLRRTPFRLA